MAKFLRTVTEAEINPQPAVNVPPVPQLPAQDGDQGNGEMVKTNQDGTRSYSGAFGTFIYDAQGKAIKYTTPNFNGYGQTIDLTNNQTTQNYNQGPLNVSKTTDAKGKQVGSNSEYTLGNVVASQQKVANGQTTNTLAPVQEGINKFLSIVKKNDVSILNEGSNPHKVALPVQMAMQHYQNDTVVKNENSLLKKYFHEVETEITEQKTDKRQLVNQYASTIAKRVLVKESKKKVLNEGSLEVLRPGDGSARDDYDKVQFRIDGEIIERGTPEFDYYYKEVFKKDPPNKFVDTLKGMMSKDHGSMGADPRKDSENDVQDGDVIIPSHEKGHWVKIKDLVEMPAHLRNDPDGHTLIPHGGMGSGKEETWKNLSTRKLQQVIDMINSGNYTGAEHVLYKTGFLQGAVQALARYEEFKAKQGKRRMKAGREVEIGEGPFGKVISKYIAKGLPSEVKLSGGLYNNRDQKVFQQFGVFPDEKAAEEFIRRNNIQDPMIDPIKKTPVDPQLKLKFEELLSKF